METRSRTWARAISYRLCAFVLSGFIVGWTTAFWLHLMLTALYYVHERLWLRVSWGRDN